MSLLLESQDMAVRRVAGEAAATLYEAIYDGVDTGGCDTESTDSSIPDLEEVTKDQVLHQMKTLSVSSTKKFQTRKERALQRKSFRQLLTTLEVCGGSSQEPSCRITLGHVSIMLELEVLCPLKSKTLAGGKGHLDRPTSLHTTPFRVSSVSYTICKGPKVDA